jgi:hypothetical protein
MGAAVIHKVKTAASAKNLGINSPVLGLEPNEILPHAARLLQMKFPKR